MPPCSNAARCADERTLLYVETLSDVWQAGHHIPHYTDPPLIVLQVVHVEADNTMAISAWAMGSAGATPHSAEVLVVRLRHRRAVLSAS